MGKQLIGVLLLCALGGIPTKVSAVTNAGASFQMPPSPHPENLDTDYPYSKCEHTSFVLLGKCTAALEAYRSSTLEPYNQSVIDYIDALKVADKRNQRLRNSNKITQDEYDDNHDQLDLEFKKTAKAGSYMARYYGHRDTFYRDRNTINAEISARRKLCGTQIGECT